MLQKVSLLFHLLIAVIIWVKEDTKVIRDTRELHQKKHQKFLPFRSLLIYGFIVRASKYLFSIQANAILQANEKTFEVSKPGTVLKTIDWNQLASNNPQEDSLAIAQLCDNRSIANMLWYSLCFISTSNLHRLPLWCVWWAWGTSLFKSAG